MSIVVRGLRPSLNREGVKAEWSEGPGVVRLIHHARGGNILVPPVGQRLANLRQIV